jgi:hypothetical protein
MTYPATFAIGAALAVLWRVLRRRKRIVAVEEHEDYGTPVAPTW